MSDIASLCRAYVKAPDYVDLTTRQFAVLAIICDEPGPHRVRHLAAKIGAQSPVITRVVDRFEQLDFATRTRDEEDGRDIEIRATRNGQKFRATLANGNPKDPQP